MISIHTLKIALQLFPPFLCASGHILFSNHAVPFGSTITTPCIRFNLKCMLYQMKNNILASVGFSQSRADTTQTYSLLLYTCISNTFFVASAEETAQASHLYYKFVSGSSLPAIQKHKRNILCKEGLKSAWREAESATVCSRQLFVANS